MGDERTLARGGRPLQPGNRLIDGEDSLYDILLHDGQSKHTFLPFYNNPAIANASTTIFAARYGPFKACARALILTISLTLSLTLASPNLNPNTNSNPKPHPNPHPNTHPNPNPNPNPNPHPNLHLNLNPNPNPNPKSNPKPKPNLNPTPNSFKVSPPSSVFFLFDYNLSHCCCGLCVYESMTVYVQCMCGCVGMYECICNI